MGADADRRGCKDLLHVAPAEVGIGLQHQGNDARDDRGREGGAAEIVGDVADLEPVGSYLEAGYGVVHLVGRDDSRTRRCAGPESAGRSAYQEV